MQISDAEVATILDNTAATADPILDILARSDPFDLKRRTYEHWWDLCPLSMRDLAATALNVADWPGTAGWDALTIDQRSDWWVNRIGALNTIAVASPGMFGAWTKKLPTGTLLGASSQALMVMAVGREHGVITRDRQIALLGAVLFGRDVDASDVEHAPRQGFPDSKKELLKGVGSALWDIARGLKKLEKALGARPQPPGIFRHLGWIPLLGGVASYAGERIALSRAVTATELWIAENPESVGD